MYEYDVEDRLTSADVGAWNSPVLFSYDAVGNRTVISDGQNGDSWQYGYGLTNNRLTSQKPVSNGVAGTEHPSSYDAMGNLIGDGIGLQLSYDATGRLVQASKGPQSMNAVYNAMGQRVIKTSGSSVRVYAVDEVGRPLGVYVVDASASNGYRVEEEYIHLDGWRPVAVIRPDSATGMNNPQVFPILSDHLGTPRKVLDGNSGQVRWTWDAKQPFGHELPNETPATGLDTFVFDLRFPGQRYDEETGLFQNGFRDYHPGLGRYVQSDPIGLDGGWNTYAYVTSNSLSFIDINGLYKRETERWTGRFEKHCVMSGICAQMKVYTMETDKGNLFKILKYHSGNRDMSQNCHAFALGIDGWINDPSQVYKDEFVETDKKNASIVIWKDRGNNELKHTSIVAKDYLYGKNGMLSPMKEIPFYHNILKFPTYMKRINANEN